MNRETFDYLLDKYIQNQCTEEETALVESWYSLVGSTKEMPKNKVEWEVLRQQVWEKIKVQMNERSSAWLKPKVLKIAASLFFALAAASTWFLVKEKNTLNYTSSNQFINSGKENKRIKLLDGSVILLFPEAKLTLDEKFNASQRKVVLVGDAYFDIAHNAQKPFFVEAGKTITKVIGTSFTIKSDKKETVEIEVAEGRVSVFEKNAEQQRENGVVLTPNQKVVYFKEKQLFVTGIVEKPTLIAIEKEIKQHSFVYENELLVTILNDIEKAYGIEIVLESETIGNCQITGDLEGDSLYEKLDIISQILGIDYQIKGTTILVSGKGC